MYELVFPVVNTFTNKSVHKTLKYVGKIGATDASKTLKFDDKIRLPAL